MRGDMKGKELASVVLQSISHPLRMTLIEKLEAQPETFSGILVLCGLDPNHSSGLFNYHLTELIRSEIVQKDGEVYRLTDFGFSILDALKKIEFECSSFLKDKEVSKLKEVEIAKPVGELLSAHDFFSTEPGHYAIYRIHDGYMGLDCNVETVLQHSEKDTFLLTFTKRGGSDDPFLDSSILYRVQQDRIAYNLGCPIGNQGWFWLLFSMPLMFRDGDTWQIDQRGHKISWIGELKVGLKSYEDCIKIHVDNTKEDQEFSFIRGEGDIYLSKGIGIIKYDFSRSSFDGDFSAEILEGGRLPRRTVSGRLLLAGEIPSVGYRVGVTGCGKESDIAANTDSQGRFSIHVFGHTLRLRYGPLQTKGNLTYISDESERKIENIAGDISGLELSLHPHSL